MELISNTVLSEIYSGLKDLAEGLFIPIEEACEAVRVKGARF